nr:MAG TPA: hypothetical protein [Microviridae sp.]
MVKKTWNVRDQTEETLRLEADRLYDQIEAKFKMVKKLSKLEDAEKTIDRIWIMKKWANDIELELLRREYNNEAQAENAGTH